MADAGSGTGAVIRVAYTIPNLDTAGSGGALANLVEALDRDHVEPVVVVDRLAGTGLEQRLSDTGVEVVAVPVRVAPRPATTLWWRARERGRDRRDLRADVWHSFHYSDDYTEPLVARSAGARWVYTKKNMSWNGRSWRVRTALAHAVLAQNTDMVDRFFPQARKAHLVPRGVPLPPPAPSRPRAEVRAELGVPDDAPLVVCVAHLQQRKRQHVLVDAMATVADAHLVLAGDELDAYGKRLDRAVVDAGVGDRVHRPGRIDDVPSLLAASDLFCLPTGAEAEGSPVALLEAMAAGLPVVVTDVPGSRDVVRSGQDGLVVPPDDVVALGRALQSLVEDLGERRRFATAARRRVEAAHDIELEARRTEACYRAVLGQT